MTNIDALAEQHYAAYDPQNVSEEEQELANLNEAVDEIIDLLETSLYELYAVRANFSTRKLNKYAYAIQEIMDELREEKKDD